METGLTSASSQGQGCPLWGRSSPVMSLTFVSSHSRSFITNGRWQLCTSCAFDVTLLHLAVDDLHLAVDDLFCHPSGSFQSEKQYMQQLPPCVAGVEGGGEFRILLLCHLPSPVKFLLKQ